KTFTPCMSSVTSVRAAWVNSGNVNEGELLSVEMSVPPTEGMLDFGGSLSNHARVVRSNDSETPEETPENVIALEFCDSPKLRT
ncbi:MAG: hypothetical protein ACO3BO_06600, partial [Anaerohalosphaeraceae bacterium]